MYSHSVIAWLTSQQKGYTAFSFYSRLLLCRLQLHKLVDHSFQTVKHFVIAKDEHF